MQRFYVLDVRRDRDCHWIEAASEDLAREEFSSWYNRVVRPDRWEKRKLGRYWLMAERRDASGELLDFKACFICNDEDVRLDADYFRMCDPPFDEANTLECEAEFSRLDGLDVARLAARGNYRPEFFDGKRWDELEGGERSGSRSVEGATPP